MQSAPATTLRATTSPLAAQLTIASSTAAILLLAVLHLLSPEFDPSQRMVSEYALGNYSWVVSLMFYTWALGCVALFIAIRGEVRTRWGKVGLVLLLVAAVGMTMGGLFDVEHSLHGLAFMLGVPALPIAALLVSTSLLHNPAWASSRTLLLWAANLPWISLVLMAGTIIISLSNGIDFGQGMLVGWPNRFLIVAYCAWTIAVARIAMRVRE